LIVRKSYGGAYLAMNSRDMGADVVLAWPTAAVAVMGAEGAANVLTGARIASRGAIPRRCVRRLIAEYRQRYDHPYVAAGRGYVDDVIDPTDTRWACSIAHLERLDGKRVERPFRKHGNMPL
jgi:methylmalonyl-CoA decarboxylase subunit alpha